MENMMQITLTLTEKDVEALEAVYQRALDDWTTYRHSGFGPQDFGATEWREHAQRTNGELARIQRLLSRARKTLAAGKQLR
jgi:hypothetical protein